MKAKPIVTVTRKIAAVLLCLTLMAGCTLGRAPEAWAGTYWTGKSTAPNYWSNKLNFGSETPSHTFASGVTKKVLDSVKNDEGTVRKKVPCVKPSASGSEWKNFLTSTYKNVGSYDGRQIDAVVTFTHLVTGETYGSNKDANSDGYMAVSYTAGRELCIGTSTNSGSNLRPWRSKKEWDVTVDLRWHDTGKTCDIPFLLDIRDIDQVNRVTKTQKVRWYESFTCSSGFANRFFYTSCKLEPYKLNSKKQFDKAATLTARDKTNKFSCPHGDGQDGLDAGGDEALTKAGFLATTTNGKFSFHYGGGNSVLKLQVYMDPFENPGKPKKSQAITD